MRSQGSKKSNFRHGLLYGLPVMAYAGLIFVLSSFPYSPEEVPLFVGYDKLAHFIEYYFFGILICRWLLNQKRHLVVRHALLMTLLVGVCYGVSDEWHQSFIPGRVASIWDVLFDGIGIAGAVLTYRITMKGNSLLNNLDKFLERKFIDEA
jgi:VanZ family protein